MPEGKSAGLAVLDNELTLDLPKRPKVLDIANAFQNLFGKAIDYRKSKPADNAKLVNTLVQEIQRAVDLHPEAKGWYDENIKLTMDVMRDLDPDLAKPENDFMFKVILAATSDGNKVGPQFQQTWKEYSNWKNTGDISGDFVSGDRIENIRGNLMMFNEMVKAIGWEKTKDFFTRKGTVKEVRQALMDTFGWTKKEAQGIGSSELTDEVVPFAVVLGPKLGSFFNNLYGDFSSVTMDRWFMRTIGRLTGTQVEPLAGAKVREMRNNLRDAVSRLTPAQFDLLGIKRSDIKGASIDDAATTISGRFAKKALRDTAKQFAESGQTALEETRKFANALKKGLNPLVEAPVDGTHRRWIRERIAEVQKDLRSRGIELENADLQAVLWYLEKELYEKLNYRSKSGESDYASAASSLYQDVVGRPSDVYARGTGRVRAVGSSGRGDGMGAADAGQAPRQEVGAQRFMPDYSGEHRAPGRDSGAPLDNLKDVYPDDVYGPNAARYYGDESGSQTDKAAVRIIQATKGKPDAPVKVFRAIPKSIQSNEINPGDWITTIKSYAVQHGEGPLGGDYKILEKTVPAGDLYTDGNSIFEFGYDPKFMPSSEQDTKALQMLPKPRRSLDAAYQDGVKTRSQDPQFYDVPDYVGYDMARTAAFEMGREGADPPRWVMAERIGKLPTEGRSKNFAEDKMERGVSALRIVGEPQSDVGTYEMFNPGEKRYIAGWLVGLGSDGEPLLADAVDLGPVAADVRMMPQPDSSMPGAYTFTGGYRALPGKTKGSLRLYGPTGSLLGIASSLDEAQRILRRKSK